MKHFAPFYKILLMRKQDRNFTINETQVLKRMKRLWDFSVEFYANYGFNRYDAKDYVIRDLNIRQDDIRYGTELYHRSNELYRIHKSRDRALNQIVKLCANLRSFWAQKEENDKINKILVFENYIKLLVIKLRCQYRARHKANAPTIDYLRTSDTFEIFKL